MTSRLSTNTEAMLLMLISFSTFGIVRSHFCMDLETRTRRAEGDVWAHPNACSLLACHPLGFVTVHGCQSRIVPLPDKCIATPIKPYLSYPECCPRVLCPVDSEGDGEWSGILPRNPPNNHFGSKHDRQHLDPVMKAVFSRIGLPAHPEHHGLQHVDIPSPHQEPSAKVDDASDQPIQPIVIVPVDSHPLSSNPDAEQLENAPVSSDNASGTDAPSETDLPVEV